MGAEQSQQHAAAAAATATPSPSSTHRKHVSKSSTSSPTSQGGFQARPTSSSSSTRHRHPIRRVRSSEREWSSRRELRRDEVPVWEDSAWSGEEEGDDDSSTRDDSVGGDESGSYQTRRRGGRRTQSQRSRKDEGADDDDDDDGDQGVDNDEDKGGQEKERRGRLRFRRRRFLRSRDTLDAYMETRSRLLLQRHADEDALGSGVVKRDGVVGRADSMARLVHTPMPSAHPGGGRLLLSRAHSDRVAGQHEGGRPGLAKAAQFASPQLRKSRVHDPKRIVRAYCSWCFQRTIHGRVDKAIVLRDAYKCQNCIHRTLECRWCNEMARGHTDWDDLLCAKCDGTIQEWGAVPDNASVIAWCSWCFQLSQHNLHITNITKRDGYRCEFCQGRTAKCLGCGPRAMTRCTSFYDDKLCAKCDTTIEDWARVEDNRQLALSKGLDVLVHNDPYLPYAPVRRNIHAVAHIDGASFYEACADAIEAATESIYMSFWHMNHRVFLRRPKGEPLDDANRFDLMIQKQARLGVKVYILLWRENSTVFAINNWSKEMKEYFEGLDPNIKVIRHGHPTPLQCVWSHHQKFVVVDQRVAFVGGLDICLGRYDTPEHVLADVDAEVWRGLDYYNPHVGRPTDPDAFDEDVLDRETVPRMPWHDVQIEVRGLAARDIAKNFIQRWNHHKDVQYPYHNLDTLELKPAQRGVGHGAGTCVVQAIRSLDKWSGGTRNERSILGAYLRAIDEAQHYIYIENQYLASSVAGSGIENKVVQHILDKVREKIRDGATFRVIFVLPQPEEAGDGALSILKWQYLTINRGGSSLMEQLHADFPDVNLEDYVTFQFLRNYAFIKGKPYTEKVFVHSKLMIVDDRIVINTSANLNDRSFLGDRDSELGVVVEDEDTIDVTMGGVPVKVGRFAQDLRIRLWQEHLAIPDDEVERIFDCTCDEVYHGIWLKTAKHNTAVYESVFPGIPRNEHTTLEKFFADGGDKVPVEPINDGAELHEIVGLLTMHPINFLLDYKHKPLQDRVMGNHMSQ